MEKSITLLQLIKDSFACEKQDIRTYSPLALAYVGDGIYEMIVRTVVVEHGNRSPQTLHKTVTKYVNAETQCEIYEAILEDLTEEELAIIKRGRNAKSYTTAKNASVQSYRKASGLEALFGYLYLTDDVPRAIELLKLGLEKTGRTL